MTELSRRSVLAGAAATALTPLAIAPARAAAPPVGKQAPGYYRYKVGAFEVTVVTDGLRVAPVADNFVRNQPKEAVEAALGGLFMSKDKGLSPFNPCVVNTGSRLVVIDTGLGPAMHAQSKGALGQFHTNLGAAGIDRNAVDTVIISHFHGDHINGLIAPDNVAAFPRAELMVPAAEWKFWMDDANMAKAPAGSPLEGNFKNVRRVFGILANRVTQYDAGKEIVPGITSVATYGHTPGHTSHVLASGNAKAMVQADVTAAIGILFVRNPGWHAVFDMDGNMAEQTRRKLYDMAAAEKMMIQGFHWSFPGLAHVEKVGTGYRLEPVPWSPTI
jgi:glyoxylase-like metal-dependent hydrolase (beta-lactamase superfamily II)